MKYDSEFTEGQALFYTKKEPRKTFQTFMRNQNKLYVNSFNVIDRKAAIMIRVNSTIVSGVVVFFEYIKNIEYGKFIGIALVVFSFVSLLFALNASRPNAFAMVKRFRKKVLSKYPETEKNIFLLGIYEHITLDDYEKAYHKLLTNQELQVGNQIRTMYLFEKQIKSAYQSIEIAYGAFIIGFVLVVLCFIVGNLIDVL
ncbi:MAG: Pycsar system effector family protein [Bacteroidota bacterium]